MIVCRRKSVLSKGMFAVWIVAAAIGVGAAERPSTWAEKIERAGLPIYETYTNWIPE